MYYQKHISGRRVIRCRRTLFILLILLSLLALNTALRPIVESMLTAQARRVFTEAVNSALLDVSSENISCDTFVTLSTDDSGRISSIQTNSMAVNRFKSSASQSIARELEEIKKEDIRVPLGTLTGIDAFTGRGPDVKLRLVQNGSITADLSSSFSEAGINQTCHAINCDVEAEFYAVIPGFKIPIELSTSVIIAQSVIVGEVPDSYTYVIGDQSDTIGRIFDYGDPYGADISG